MTLETPKVLQYIVCETSVLADDPKALLTDLTFVKIDEEFVSLKDAASLLDMKRASYVRTLLITEGLLDGVKIQLTGYPKWFVTITSLQQYRRTRSRRGKPRRYILHISKDDEDQVRALLRQHEVEFRLEVAYK